MLKPEQLSMSAILGLLKRSADISYPYRSFAGRAQ